jgi:pimeloyl-ACP methyl ester carboxylesterase
MSVPSPVFPVLAHDYNSTLVPHACIYELLTPDVLSNPAGAGPGGAQKKKHALVFIGGLGDGPHTVPAVRAVAARMSERLPDWSVFEVRLNSSFGQWGFSSLKEDAREIGEVVNYLRGRLGRNKVVLMGHSTGCQV